MIAKLPVCNESISGSDDLTDFENLISKCRIGCADSRNRIVELIQPEIYQIAQRLTCNQRFANSLHATVLVNETFIRLLKSGLFHDPRSRGYFFAAAGQAMRNVIADYFRNKQASKRSPDGKRVFLDDVIDQLETQQVEFAELDKALSLLESKAPRQAHVVQMRFFLGMSVAEIARQLSVSVSTVESDWRRARAWLYKELN